VRARRCGMELHFTAGPRVVACRRSLEAKAAGVPAQRTAGSGQVARGAVPHDRGPRKSIRVEGISIWRAQAPIRPLAHSPSDSVPGCRTAAKTNDMMLVTAGRGAPCRGLPQREVAGRDPSYGLGRGKTCPSTCVLCLLRPKDLHQYRTEGVAAASEAHPPRRRACRAALRVLERTSPASPVTVWCGRSQCETCSTAAGQCGARQSPWLSFFASRIAGFPHKKPNFDNQVHGTLKIGDVVAVSS
jgi:hypothetical protein